MGNGHLNNVIKVVQKQKNPAISIIIKIVEFFSKKQSYR